MISDKEKKSLHQPSAKRRFFLFVQHSFLWVLAGIVLLWLSSFFLVASVAERKMEELCGGAAFVQTGRLNLGGAIRLKGVMIAADEGSLAQSPFFQADEIELKFSPWRLLRGQFQIYSVNLDGLYVSVDYHAADDKWNIPNFNFGNQSSSQGPLPFVTVQNGTVQVRKIEGANISKLVTAGINGKIAADTEAGQYSFKLEADERFGFGGSCLEGLFKIPGSTRLGHLSMHGQFLMHDESIFDNTWNVKDILFECEFDRQQVMLKRCSFSTNEGQADIHGSLRKEADKQNWFDLAINLTHFQLSDSHQPDTFVYGQLLKRESDSPVIRFLRQYRPVGAVDVGLSFRGPLDDLAAVDMKGEVVCQNISALYEKFPYPIDHLTGEIKVDGHDFSFNELVGHHGDVDVMINGFVKNGGDTREMDIHVSVPNIMFDDDLYNALNDSVKKVWFSYSPSGRAGVDYHYRRFLDGRREKSLKLEMKNASVVYEYFPYPYENLTGTVTVGTDEVVLDNLIAHYDDGRRVTLNGKVLKLASQHPEIDVHIDAQKIPVDDLLINAMPAEQRDFLNRLEIDALANMDVIVKRDAATGHLLDFAVNLEVDGQQLVYDEFPVPMTDVHLAAKITNQRMELQTFRAAVDGGTVSMEGRLVPKGADQVHPDVCLDVDIQNFDLNQGFWQALGENADVLFGKLRPQGRVNVTGHLSLNQGGESCGVTALEIQCADNALMWDELELAKANGTLKVSDDVAVFENFKLSGIDLESLPRSLLSEKVQLMYNTVDPRGKVSILLKDGFVKFNKKGLRAVDVDLKLGLEEVTGGPRHNLHQLYGSAIGHFSLIVPTGYCRMIMKYDIDHCLWDHYLITDVKGQFVYDPETSHLESKDFTANLYGGTIMGDVGVDFSGSEGADYQLVLSLEGTDVKELLSAEYESARENVFEGTASGSLALSGNFRKIAESQGKVTARVEKIKLGQQSIMGKVLTGMQLKVPSDFVFNQVSVEGILCDRIIAIESLNLSGKPMAFWGSGQMNLMTNELAIDLVAFEPVVGDEQMILNRLARGIGKAIWKVEVKGPVSKPEIKTVYFSVLKQPLNIFKKNQE